MNKQQLANKIWASANKMRSKIDANEYKDYILGLIFYKFLSDNEVNYLYKVHGWEEEYLPSLVEDYEDEDMAALIEDCKQSIGYFIEYKNLFSTWLLPDSTFSVAELSVALNRFDSLISDNYKRVYENIFVTLQAGLSKLGNSPAEQTKALKGLIKLIKDIPTDSKQDYDVLGYVYEYLIGNFAANAGKKAGEFYTPHEVAILMSEIVAEHHKDKDKIEIYDPTSGSGSLLLTIGKSVGRHIEDKNRVKYYAQELKENTYNLTRMNLVMRGIRPGNIDTRCADSLGEDWPIQKTGPDAGKPLYVDAVVSNPPYSQHWDPSDAEMDARFKDYGVAPKSKADYAFLLHELHHLKPDGVMTIVLPHGVLFRGAPDDEGEGKIRKRLIEKNQIDAIIGLPANIFFGTGIPTLIMVLKQHRQNDDILIIDASKGFVKDGKQNKLRASDIKRIADTWRNRADVPGFSRKVTREEVRENGYNLNIPRYVDSSEAPEQYDIYATMFGGIPNSEIDKLQKYWDVFPLLKKRLFTPIPGKAYSRRTDEDVLGAFMLSSDAHDFKDQFFDAIDGLADKMDNVLVENVMTVKEMQAHDELAAEIFRRLENIPLVDCYRVYQLLSNQWQMIVNDIETIQTEGLDAVRTVEPAMKLVKDGDDEKEVPDGMKGRILPFELVQKDSDILEKYFFAVKNKEERQESIAGEIEELLESLTEDEAQEYMEGDDTPKPDKAKIKKDAKAKGDDIEPETKGKLQKLAALWDEQTKLNKSLKEARQTLTDKTIEYIQGLSDDIAKMWISEKWVTPVMEGIADTPDNICAELEKAVDAMSQKYATSYHDLNDQLVKAQDELSGLISQLEGDESSIAGLNALMNSFKD
ncbi:MAG: type I restriction-modification system subunit M [Prevotella sp.]|nr:type I restriction-modification system subunit M [Prevotella sp.]